MIGILVMACVLYIKIRSGQKEKTMCQSLVLGLYQRSDGQRD